MARDLTTLRTTRSDPVSLAHSAMLSPAPTALCEARRSTTLALALAATLVCFSGWWLDEVSGTPALYATISRDLAEGAPLLPLHHAGELYVNKPPLGFWLTALLFKLGGALPALASVLPRLAGVATVMLVHRLGERLVGPGAGLVAGLAVLLNPPFMGVSNTFRLDTQVLACLLACWVTLVGARAGWGWRVPVACAWLLLGSGFKGPIVLVGLVPILVQLSLNPTACGGWRRWLAWSPVLLLTFAWPLYVRVALGPEALTNLAADVNRPYQELSIHAAAVMDQYLWRPAVMWLPFSLLMVAGLWLTLRHRNWRTPRAVWRLGLAALVAVVVVVLTLKSVHRTGYLLYAVPALAVLATVPGARLWRRWHRAMAWTVASLAIIGTFIVAALIPDRNHGARWSVPAITSLLTADHPTGPIPVLVKPAWIHPPAGAEWGDDDWCRFNLGRPCRPVQGAELDTLIGHLVLTRASIPQPAAVEQRLTEVLRTRWMRLVRVDR